MWRAVRAEAPVRRLRDTRRPRLPCGTHTHTCTHTHASKQADKQTNKHTNKQTPSVRRRLWTAHRTLSSMVDAVCAMPCRGTDAPYPKIPVDRVAWDTLCRMGVMRFVFLVALARPAHPAPVSSPCEARRWLLRIIGQRTRRSRAPISSCSRRSHELGCRLRTTGTSPTSARRQVDGLRS